MTPSILTAAGIVHHRRGRFVKPPGGTYAVWKDNVVDTDGPDGMPPCIFYHAVTIELYEPLPDDAAEAALETQMTAQGLHWTKQDRYWIDSEQMYQVIYEFSHVKKRRN